MDINIPEKYREEFDRSADFAVKTGKFTVKELSAELNVGELVASIMIGYMEKTGHVTKGKSDDVRRAKISEEEREKMGRKKENYTPIPDPEPEKFVPEVEEKELTVTDIIPEKLTFFKKSLSAGEGFVIISDTEDVAISLDDISKIFVRRPSLLKKGALIFSTESELSSQKPEERADAVLFEKKDLEEALSLAERLSERLGVEVKIYR